MKSVLIAILLVSGTVFGAEVPQSYSMSCWDHSFAYNRMEVEGDAKSVRFELSGMTLAGNQKLVSTDDQRFFEMRILTSFDRRNCQINAADPKLILCATSGTTDITIKADRMGDGQNLEKVVSVESAQILVRKITMLGSGGRLTSGYELMISSHFGEVLVQHQLFLNNGFDNASNCALK